jgi:hypothetical protein
VYKNNVIKNLKSVKSEEPVYGVYFNWSKNAKVFDNKFSNLRPGRGARLYPLLEHDFKWAPTTGAKASGNTLNGKAAELASRLSQQTAPC